MQKQRSGFSIFFLIFLISTRQVGWQGYGNWTSSNLTEIWTFINGSIGSRTSTSSYDTFNTALSNHLNTLWAPAWNVFTIKTTAEWDTVLYGYAFNDHWMWYNDYEINGVVLAFVIWKDYNCENNWKTVGQNGAASGFTLMKDKMGFFTWTTVSKDDLWNAVKSFVDRLSVYDNQIGGYSAVGSQDNDAELYGRICVKGENFFLFERDSARERPFIQDSNQ